MAGTVQPNQQVEMTGNRKELVAFRNKSGDKRQNKQKRKMTYAYQNAAHKLNLKSGNWIPQRKPTVTATTALHQMHTENRLFMLNLELWIQTDLCTDNSFRHSHALAATDRSDIHANKGRFCVLPCTCLINKKKPVCVCLSVCVWIYGNVQKVIAYDPRLFPAR